MKTVRNYSKAHAALWKAFDEIGKALDDKRVTGEEWRQLLELASALNKAVAAIRPLKYK